MVRGMQELPGRKSIMLISDGFKLYEENDGFKESGRVMYALRRLADAANRASVVIYTLDARGLVVTGLTAADDTSGRDAAEIAQTMSDRSSQLFDTQDGLKYLAAVTGGYAIVNSNDLSGGIRRVLDDQSYYLVGYQPEDETFDPKTRRFNQLEIKVKRPGVKVRYRSGFFGITDEKLGSATQPTGQQRLANALTSPFAVNQVAIRLNTLFGNTPANGPYLRSLLHIQTQDLKF
ncbi:MAG TPA: VWA domain-containing protein, partial [Pyrinomonadaceae bacterium]|nr:VWA domain-containing protein [Pyrinomonadaceae bacterium]